MRSVAVFQWKGEQSNIDDDCDPEQATLLLSQPIAVALLNALRERGYATNVSIPYDGEGGWHFTLSIGDAVYNVFTMWATIGKSDEDYFVVQLAQARGCIGLFLPHSSKLSVEPACQAVDATIDNLPQVVEFQWLNDSQFHACYCEGKPLPPREA